MCDMTHSCVCHDSFHNSRGAAAIASFDEAGGARARFNGELGADVTPSSAFEKEYSEYSTNPVTSFSITSTAGGGRSTSMSSSQYIVSSITLPMPRGERRVAELGICGAMPST
mmetsp:Transcript_2196/g.3060  ORF Transcript_2196/g.3060 Transcript_2196/m.3060 type:complete len:113 (+) Transcript_2196:13-351(+)